VTFSTSSTNAEVDEFCIRPFVAPVGIAN